MPAESEEIEVPEMGSKFIGPWRLWPDRDDPSMLRWARPTWTWSGVRINGTFYGWSGSGGLDGPRVPALSGSSGGGVRG